VTDITSLQILKTRSCKFHFNIIHRPQFIHWRFQTETFRTFPFYLVPPIPTLDHFNNIWRRKHHRMGSETLQFLGSCLVSLTFSHWHVCSITTQVWYDDDDEDDDDDIRYLQRAGGSWQTSDGRTHAECIADELPGCWMYQDSE